MRKFLLALALVSVVSIGHANAACSSYPHTLTNGTPADATQVMANFNCAALTSGTTLENVGRIGIGTVGTNALDVTQSGGSPTIVKVLNSTTGAGAIAALQVANAAGHTGYFYMFGSAFTPSGLRRADGAYLASDGVGGLTINTDVSQPIYFGIDSVEAARIGTDRSFLVGTTTNGGWNNNSKLEARQATGGYALSAHNSYTGVGGGGALLARVDSTNNPNLAAFIFGGSVVGTITTNGTTTTYNTTSDERLKAWRIPQTDYEQSIRNLWVGDFQWKANGERDFGIRAQQAYTLFPAAIRKPTNDQSGQWEADYGRLAPLALWGVQKLYHRTDDQQAKLASTQADVKAIVTEVAALRRMYAEIRAESAKLSEKLQSLDRGAVQLSRRQTR